jgi:hypothetical protein
LNGKAQHETLKEGKKKTYRVPLKHIFASQFDPNLKTLFFLCVLFFAFFWPFQLWGFRVSEKFLLNSKVEEREKKSLRARGLEKFRDMNFFAIRKSAHVTPKKRSRDRAER